MLRNLVFCFKLSSNSLDCLPVGIEVINGLSLIFDACSQPLYSL